MKNKRIKPRYPNMKTSQVIKCPHYEGDGYRYNLNRIEFLFCESCNNGLLSQMIEQKKLEEQLNTQIKPKANMEESS